MADDNTYAKAVKDRIDELGQKLKDAATTAAGKVGGMLGSAVNDIRARPEKIDKAVDDATKMADGGRVARKPQRG
jgi:ribosomal protein L18